MNPAAAQGEKDEEVALAPAPALQQLRLADQAAAVRGSLSEQHHPLVNLAAAGEEEEGLVAQGPANQSQRAHQHPAG